jgi:hypothetical protein
MPQYQGVWTLEQQAQAQSNQQWVTDPNFKNTTLLLQADGTGSGSQNQTFLDGSTNNFFITRNGNTTQGSFSPFGPSWSNYFADGSSSYLTLSSGPTFGSGDYTLEFFAYKTTSWTDGFDFLDAATSGLALYVSSGTMAVTKQNVGGTAVVLGSLTSLSPNAWHHFAIVRSSGSVRCYVNGSPLQAAVSDANNYTVATTKICGTSDGYFDGYISNMRLATSALYSIAGSSITVPTAPLATATGVQYLGSQSNRFVDTTGTQTVAVGGGTPSVQTFSPFAPALQWTPDVVGGSGYFDGTGDYLSVANNTAFKFGTGNFTIDGWFYFSGLVGAYSALFTIGDYTNGILMRYQNSGGPNDSLYIGNTSYNWAPSTNFKLNQWNHVALVKNGTGSNNVQVYINGVSVLTITSSYDLQPTGLVYIGTSAHSLGDVWNGYISNFRLVKGTAVYTSTFTPPTVPTTAITNTQLLLNFTNAGIYDGKMANNLETVGNAQVATSPVKYGSGSMYFDGTGDYLKLPSNAIYAFNTGAYTIEFWIYPNSLAAGTYHVIGANATNGIIIAINNAKIALNKYGVGDVLAYNTALTTSVWTHVAVVRDGTGTNQTKIYVNGTNVATGTDSNDWSVTTNFGVGANTSDGSQAINAYLDDLRVTKGVARYYANFTPPQQALPRQ